MAERKVIDDQVWAKLAMKVFGSDVNGERIQTVNARDEWKWLEVKQEFSHWIKQRIHDGLFEEGVDYITVRIKKLVDKINGLETTMIEYHISLEMAKHIAMMERNAKGRQARKYFIACEKELFDVKKIIAETQQFLHDLNKKPISLQGFEQLSLEDRKKQRSQIWEIWRKTNAISSELNYRRIQVAKKVNLIINGMTTYRFRQRTGARGLARDWMPIANQYCFYLAEYDLLEMLRGREFDVTFDYIEQVYPQLAQLAKTRVELMHETILDDSIEAEIEAILESVRTQDVANITPYVQTEGQILQYQHELTHELERLGDLLAETKAA